MKEIEKLDYVSFGLVMGIIQAILGLIGSILGVALISAMLSVIGIPPQYAGFVASYLAAIGIGWIILSVVLGFIGGFILGLIIALIYNLFLHKYIKIKAE